MQSYILAEYTLTTTSMIGGTNAPVFDDSSAYNAYGKITAIKVCIDNTYNVLAG